MIEDKGYRGAAMEGRVATWYANNTLKELVEFQRLAQRISGVIPSNCSVLEVAPGPGYLSIQLAKLGQYRIVGLDISKSFVEIATANAREESVKVDFREGNASKMPFDDESFDFIVCRAAFKNFSQPAGAINEMHRVLKPGGSALIVDLNKSASVADIDAYIQQTSVSWFNKVLYKIIFRTVLIPRSYSCDQLMHMASESKFGTADISQHGISLEVNLKKGT